MTAAELRALLAASGLSQLEAARRLDVNPRTMRRWVAGSSAITPDAEERLVALLGGRAPTDDDPWPRDEWILGDNDRDPDRDPDYREYLVHTRAPRFVARVVDELADDDTGWELSGLSYSTGGQILCEFAWIDPIPRESELLELLDRAGRALD